MKRGGLNLFPADEASKPTAGGVEGAGNDKHYITIRTHRRYASLDQSEAQVRGWTQLGLGEWLLFM